jgi:hypothetical protein
MKSAATKTYKRWSFFIFLSLLTLYFSLNSCSTTPTPLKAEQEGEILAKKYCNTCHKYPEPALIDQESWQKHVLPSMAQRLGIKVYSEDMYINTPDAKSLISYDNWVKIVAFYKANAPQKLKPAKHTIQPVNNWAYFKLVKPVTNVSVATTTLVSFDTISKHIYTSDMMTSSLYQWSNKLALQKTAKFASSAVDAKFSRDAKGNARGAFTFIGSFDAFDRQTGQLKDIDLNNIKSTASINSIAGQLNRAVQSATADFNKDGLADWVVCQFGHNLGELSLFTQAAGGAFNKTAIRKITGPTNVTIGDFNNDGWPDVMCLFAQGDEGLWMFLNNHKGGFTTKNLLRFPPVYGSTSFQLVDMNNDGKPDVLYTCGDNSDYSRVLKPYHGVYIFLNQGDFKFKQACFYPINGATKAIAADFNGDKKMDIAVIAFFSDLKNNPAEGFTYLEQTKSMQFTANNIPIDKLGRWICMDVKDYNGDGKPDIILGNFSVWFINDEGVKKNWDTKMPFIILQNEHN